MRNPLTHYVLLAQRWAWVIFLGVALCGGTTYAITKLTRPTYQASALLLVRFTTTGSDYDKTTAALEVLPTYAQLIANPTALQPVLAQHKNLTLKRLIPMISVKPQSNTQIIEVDVTNTDPQLATQLANEISQSLAHYSNTALPATVDVFQALPPTDPYPTLASTRCNAGRIKEECVYDTNIAHTTWPRPTNEDMLVAMNVGTHICL